MYINKFKFLHLSNYSFGRVYVQYIYSRYYTWYIYAFAYDHHKAIILLIRYSYIFLRTRKSVSLYIRIGNRKCVCIFSTNTIMVSKVSGAFLYNMYILKNNNKSSKSKLYDLYVVQVIRFFVIYSLPLLHQMVGLASGRRTLHTCTLDLITK